MMRIKSTPLHTARSTQQINGEGLYWYTSRTYIIRPHQVLAAELGPLASIFHRLVRINSLVHTRYLARPRRMSFMGLERTHCF
jgi:hypothetical protein